MMKNNRMLVLFMLLTFFLLSCNDKETEDKNLYVGIASVKLLPDNFEANFETHNETTGDYEFNGCVEKNEITSKCKETFNDLNNNGIFEPIWIGGFDFNRPATGVHDPIKAVALYVKYKNDYFVLVGMDLVGLMFNRIDEARDLLEEQGLNRDKVLFSSSHTHQGPDVVGIWGQPFTSMSSGSSVSGINKKFQESLPGKLAEAVLKAKENLTKVEMKVSSVKMREVNPYFNGAKFGGKNPKNHLVGLLNDIRDPIIVNDDLFTLAFNDNEGNRVATLVNFSGHPEIVGDENTLISADYIYYLRKWHEEKAGGTAMFLPSSLGGMMSAYRSYVPLVDDSGVWQYQKCTQEDIDNAVFKCSTAGDDKLDEDDEKIPEWAERDSYDLARSFGYILAQIGEEGLDKADIEEFDSINMVVEPLKIPVSNRNYELMEMLGLLELGGETLDQTDETCPWYGKQEEVDEYIMGCMPASVNYVKLGPWEAISAPGELFPELYLGIPNEDEFTNEALRGSESKRFPQHNINCTNVEFADCREKMKVRNLEGEVCECLAYHSVPYTLDEDTTFQPVVGFFKEAKYRAIIGNGNGYGGYIVPSSDINWAANMDEDGDHYEETVSASPKYFSSQFLKAVKNLFNKL